MQPSSHADSAATSGDDPAGAARAEPSAALAGLRVLELGDSVAVAFCGRWLAGFGADVIKVEPPDGDWTRDYAAVSGAAPEQPSALYRFLNTGKRSVTLPLHDSDAASRRRLRALVRHASIVIHPFSRQDTESLQIGGDEQDGVPAPVLVAITEFGSDGPYAGFAGAPIVALALGGYLALSGAPDGEPLMLPGFQSDLVAGLHGVITALALHLEGAGPADRATAEVSALEVIAALHQFTTVQYSYEGSVRHRNGNRRENLHPSTLLPCADGYAALALPTNELWERQCLMMGRPDLATDPRFATPAARWRHADELDRYLLAWLGTQSKEQYFRRGQEDWMLPIGPLHELPELFDDPQLQHRRFWRQVEQLDGSNLTYPGFATAMSASPWTLRPIPALGEHSRQVERELADREAAEPKPPEHAETFARGLNPPPSAAARTPRVSAGRPRPLAGVRVADFTRVWAGPLATRVLADLGAEVIKLEAPGSRRSPPQSVDDSAARAGTAAAFGSFRKLNRNKLSLVVDLRRPEGRAVVRQLVGICDVVIDNFSARVMPSFGLGAEALLALNPSLVVVAMPGFGSDGPYRDYVAYGQAIEPMTGLTALMGYEAGGPMITGGAYPDPVAGVTAACAILTALVYRRRTGRGQFIDLSQVEATISLLGEQIVRQQLGGPAPRRLGNADPEWAPQGCYRCAGDDGWLAVCVRTEQQWQALCRVSGLERLAGDTRFSNVSKRRESRGALDTVLSAWTSTRDKHSAMRTLQAAGVPAGAVSNARELVQDQQLNATGFFVHIDDPPFGTIPYPGLPLRLGGERVAPARRAPALGEHERYVVQELLGQPGG